MPRADNSGAGGFPDDDAHLNLKPLARLGAWGGGAAIALGLAVMAAQSDMGGRRAEFAMAALTGSAGDQAARTAKAETMARADAEREARRLAEAVRTLSGDRDRLAGRVALLERNLEDLTGSVARATAQPRPPAEPAKPTELPPVASAPQTTVPVLPPVAPAAGPAPKPAPGPAAAAPVDPPPALAPPTAVTVTPLWRENAELPAIPPKERREPQDAETVPLPRPGPVAVLQSYAGAGATSTVAGIKPAGPDASGPSPQAQRAEYAIDLGGAANLAGLRALWEKVRIRQPASLDGLRPLVGVRDGTKPGTTELRLIAGPLVDTTAVARICAALMSVGIACQPAVFDGQRLPGAEPSRPRAAPAAPAAAPTTGRPPV